MNILEILKSRSGVYKDTSKNRRLHRVGQRYGEQKAEDEQGGEKKSKYEERKARLRKYFDQRDAILSKIKGLDVKSEEYKLGQELLSKLNPKIEKLYNKIARMKENEGRWEIHPSKIEAEDELRKKITENNQEISKEYHIPIGQPMTFEEADGKKTNPHFMESKAYRSNCQTCVVAYELRRRGFDVSAARRSSSKSCQTNLSFNQNYVFQDPEYNKFLQPNNKAEFYGKIEEYTKEVGRYHIGFYYFLGKSRYGHIVTLERLEDGSLFLYDPQSSLKSTIEDYFLGINLDTSVHAEITRVDNALFKTLRLDGLLDLRGKPKIVEGGKITNPSEKKASGFDEWLLLLTAGGSESEKKVHIRYKAEDGTVRRSYGFDKKVLKYFYKDRATMKSADSFESYVSDLLTTQNWVDIGNGFLYYSRRIGEDNWGYGKYEKFSIDKKYLRAIFDLTREN